MNRFKSFLFGTHFPLKWNVNLGIFLIRFIIGLAFFTVFEKFLPKEGIWGPQEWFISDVRDMGFPLPTLFAWIVSLGEFFGGLFLMLGLFTRPFAILNAIITFVAAFVYHNADIGQSGMTAFIFMIMCISTALAGGGKYSLDYLIFRRNEQGLTAQQPLSE